MTNNSTASPARPPTIAPAIVLRGRVGDGEIIGVVIEVGEQDWFSFSLNTGMRFMSFV
jgi:hypothetical protein